jgi:rhodanese-related sulfurtransferase
MDIDSVPRISCEEFKAALDAREDIVVIDTRRNSSYNVEHIPGAVNINYDPSGDPAEREMILSALPGNRPLIFYCN